MPLPRARAAATLLALLAATVGLGVRLVLVQAVGAEQYAALARRQRVRVIVLPAQRGTIYDRFRNQLAMSVPARTVYANPKQVRDATGTAAALAPILGRPVRELTGRLERRSKGFVYLARQVDVDVAGRVDDLRLPGLGVIAEPRRSYPGGRLASNVVGFVGGEGTGLEGLEAGYEALLRGSDGERVLEQDPSGRPIPQGEFHEEAPVAGADLVLTLDRDLQYAAEQALARAVEATDAQGGSVVAIDPVTGDILAMANSPTFDPNDVAAVRDVRLTRNRAVTDMYEPGSANKIVTAAGAIEEGVAAPSSPFSVPARIIVAGTAFSDAHGHATKTLAFADIIAQSSNVGTIKVALKLGPQRLEEYLKRFGYGRSTALGFPGESPGLVPSATRWKTSLPTMAIGQGVSVTPLQIVRAFATIAHDGIQVEPRLVSGWIDRSGAFHAAPESRVRRVVSAPTASAVRSMLIRAVSDAHGTGTAAQVPGYTVAGKTGTAQRATGRGYQGYMASFIGMVPAESPRLVIGVVLDNPSPIWGGVVAAPVFREVAQAAVRILRIPPNELSRSQGGTLALGTARRT